MVSDRLGMRFVSAHRHKPQAVVVEVILGPVSVDTKSAWARDRGWTTRA
jgi:hypothetical protein